MALPHIPSQDVAKLVLGYLAEEQLMTAYDEFLQTSPYLNAQQNEYDRIFMTSLKLIIAEYRALRIQVENCQPIVLRRKLLQLPNLAEILRFLINNVDLQKINPIIPNNAQSQNQHHCRELSQSHQRDQLSAHTLRAAKISKKQTNLVETTSLVDLPGNNKSIRCKDRMLDKNTKAISPFNITNEREPMRAKTHMTQVHLAPASAAMTETSRSHLDGSVQSACSLSLKPHNLHDAKHSFEHNSSLKLKNLYHLNNSDRVCSETFQDFASGVTGPTPMIVNVPDSSTTENLPTKNPELPNKVLLGKKTQILMQVNSPNLVENRLEESRIRIISDVKVDDPTSRLLKPCGPRNATSTPAMKTLVIGSNQQNQPLNQRSYTKDEIMAMPTIILVPASGPPPSKLPQTFQINSIAGCSGSAPLEPLRVEVEVAQPPSAPPAPVVANEPVSLPGLITTSEQTSVSVPKESVLDLKNASVPKDSVVSIVGKTSTPQVLPPARKSSSTPRRTSHVRILDFATPRRILHGTIQEHAPQNEVLLSRSPNLVINEDKEAEEEAAKENKPDVQPIKKQNWDAELRALVGTTVPVEKTPKPKPRSSKKKKKPPESTVKMDTPKTAKKSAKKTLSPKADSNTKIRESIESSKETAAATEVVVSETTVKPTINLITDWNNSPPKEEKAIDKSAEVFDNKSGELQSDTPEMDRLLLQNAIGAKLNISDLLETPYKQALYDIQMETPRFLRPDIPGSEPVSEIKITDIPTPRFLATTPGVQATPGEYCSRATDYSSGGSYYKPDDHDYAPLPELDCVMETKMVEIKTHVETNETKSTRPVRKCTKNISYCDPKGKTVENRIDLDSSEDASILDVTEDTAIDVKKITNNISGTKDGQTKSKESKKKSTSAKNRRQSKKCTPNKFMKIKPRRPTPVKMNRSKSKKEGPKSPGRKRTSSIDKSSSTAPAATPALTKSRRKSSTPRKLHTKVVSSESLDTNSSESTNRGKEMNKFTAPIVHDSDTETLDLPCSDCSHGTTDTKKVSPADCSANEIEDINKIRAYIESTVDNASKTSIVIEDENSSLQDFVKRGFDIETAKIIERDLLGPCSVNRKNSLTNMVSFPVQVLDLIAPSKPQKNIAVTIEEEKTFQALQTASETKSDMNDDEEEVEFSVYECNEESINYCACEHDVNSKLSTEPVRIKDNFSVDIHIEDEVIHLRTSQYKSLFDQEPGIFLPTSVLIETDAAVRSITNMDRLYTPLKDQRTSIQAQCIEIFDSTLTSLDTPLKADSPKRKEMTITELVDISIEREEAKDKGHKKRKRTQSSPDTAMESKKNKKESRYLPNIQNFDIDTVLSKLHGP